MKKFLAIAAILACAACSSAPKETTVSSDVPNTPPATQANQAATEKAESMKTDAKKEAHKAHKKAKEAAAEAKADAKDASANAAASTGTEFGAINGTEKSSVTCSSKGDTRKITIMNVTEGGCGVVYNKAGADKTVAMAKNGGDYCDTVSNKIKSNLEGAGYDCGGGTSTDKAAAPAKDEKKQ